MEQTATRVVIIRGRHQRLDRDEIARLKMTNSSSGFYDVSREFVPQDLRQGCARQRVRFLGRDNRTGDEFMQIGAANPAHGGRDEHLARFVGSVILPDSNDSIRAVGDCNR